MPKGEKKAGGRPKVVKNHSEAVKRNWLRAARKLAREFGMSVEEYLLRMLFDDQVQDTAKIAIGKLYNEALLIKESKQTVEQVSKPQVYLPEIAPRPAAEAEEEHPLHG
jgi:hypothetical protein